MQINQLLDHAEQHHRSGQLDRAAEFYQQALGLAPGHADAQYGLGTVLMQRNKAAEAVPYLEAATKQLPDVPEFLFNLALCLIKLQRVEEAKGYLLRAAGLSGRDPYLLLPICTQMIEYGLAGQAYGALDATGATSAKVTVLKAKALGALGDWRGSARLLAALAAQTPDDPLVWFEHSKAAGWLRDYDAAITSFETYLSLKKDPGGEDYLKFADLLLTARYPEKAKTILSQAVDAGVDRAEAHHIAAKCARLEGNEEEVLHFAELALERRPAFGQVWQLKAEILPDGELAALADRCVALVNDPTSTEWDQVTLEMTAGQAYEKLARYDEAFDSFARGNALQKPLLKKKNFEYSKVDTEAEYGRILGYYPEGTDFPEAEIRSNPRAIFIVGMPRSGTTLVEKILACLDGVEAGGENEAFEFLAAQYYWDLAQGHRPPPAQLPQETLNGMAAVYWDKTQHSQSVVTDKMPHNFRHLGLICQTMPDARIVYMKRDPRDVCLSIFCRVFSEAHRYAVDVDWLAHFYAQTERMKRHWMARFPDRILDVNYETLVDQPVEQTQAIADFCGLDWHPGCLEFHKKAGSSFTFSELQVRKPLNRKGIGRWRHYETQLAPLSDALHRYGLL